MPEPETMEVEKLEEPDKIQEEVPMEPEPAAGRSRPLAFWRPRDREAAHAKQAVEQAEAKPAVEETDAKPAAEDDAEATNAMPAAEDGAKPAVEAAEDAEPAVGHDDAKLAVEHAAETKPAGEETVRTRRLERAPRQLAGALFG